MQDMMQRFGLPAGEPAPDDDAPMDRNQAAIALALAMDRARAEWAERDGGEDDRAQAIGRLEALRRRLQPLYAAIPREVEHFDLGFVAHERPRLFVDIVAYVEPAGDGRRLRLVQETRAGRSTLIETDGDGAMIEAVTRYVARRLVARERALAAEMPLPLAPPDEPSAPVEPREDESPSAAMPRPTAPMTAEEAFLHWTRPREEPPPKVEAADEAREAEAPIAALAEPAAGSAPTKPAAEEAAERRWPAATPRAQRPASGWWLWPLAALAIGVGLGALALYLYAATLPA